MNARHYNAERIRQLRREKSAAEGRDITQDVVAEALGVHRQSIYRAENGLDVAYELLCDLAEYYDVEVTSWLYARPLKEAAKAA
jgi:transcriptional regulator with XRE-family HTH domain